MAVRTTFLSALSAWLAAPVPRPPQPISPMRSVSLFAENALCERLTLAANTDPTVAAADVFRNCLREVDGETGSLIDSLGSRFMDQNRIHRRSPSRKQTGGFAQTAPSGPDVGTSRRSTMPSARAIRGWHLHW